MSLSLDTQCLLCLLERNIAVARSCGTEPQATAFAKDLMHLLLNAPADASAPVLNPRIAALLQRHYGISPNRFQAEKEASNAFILARMDQIREKVRAAADPVFAALQFSILGNYLDFSALRGEVSFERLDHLLENALQMELDGAVYDAFCADLKNGKRLLYLTDNAGEIGFDRILAEAIQEKHPHLAITFCVRGGQTQNDATREDAATVGIPFPIIDNGNLVAGTDLKQLSREAAAAFAAADVILAKGQGNAETLLGCGHNVYYAFLVKCRRFMEHFQKPKLTPMLVKELPLG